MKKRLFLLVLFFFLAIGVDPPTLFSQEIISDKTLSLEECIQVALKKRPELEVSNLDILNAEYQIKEAQSYYYPRLNLNAGYTRFNEPLRVETDIDVRALTKDVNTIIEGQFGLEPLPSFIHEDLSIGKRDLFAINLELTQPIYTFGRIKEGVNQARISRSLAVTQKEKKRTEIVFEVKKGYFQFLAAREALHLLRETEAKLGVVVKMVKIAYETAVPEKEEKGTTRLDYLKARNFHSEVRAKLSEMDKNFKLAELALKMAMGLDTSAPLKVAEVSLEGLPVNVWSLGELKERTLTKNTDLKSVDLGVQFFDSRRKTANKEYFPKVGLFGNYVGPEDRYGNNNVWYAGIGLTMPLFEGFQTKAKIGQAEAQFQKVRGQRLILEKALSVQIDHLNTNLIELRERIQILQAAIQEAQERTGLASDGYAAGITEYDELLLAQKAELEAKSIHLQTLFNYQMIKSEIEYVSGMQ
ncbi:MAG TPA: TolC family protein [Thermodesulfobacteriota bacterium]|nr:TolC family protein [Thermodesulfobacteriota bacterium]